MNIFCFGLGYTALRLAGHVKERGGTIHGTVTSAEKQAQLRKDGIGAFLLKDDSHDPAMLHVLSESTHILISIPPDAHGQDAAASFLSQELPSLEWLGYLSATSVYGDHEGTVVTEISECRPTSARAVARYEAEKKWRDKNAHIFRLSGIYGPYRNVLYDLKNESIERINAPDHLFSRIHVDDICRALLASMQQPQPEEIYNLADDHPTSRLEVVDFAYDFLNIPKPPLVDLNAATLSPGGRSFYQDRKIVGNAKMKRLLIPSLQYPSYREGLEACYREENR